MCKYFCFFKEKTQKMNIFLARLKKKSYLCAEFVT